MPASALVKTHLALQGHHFSWACPDVMRNLDISLAKAKKAIADYKKALGRPEGPAELSVYSCEEVFAFLGYCGLDDEGYYSALVRMFEQTLKANLALVALTSRQGRVHREVLAYSPRDACPTYNCDLK